MSPTFGTSSLKGFERTINSYFDEFLQGAYQQSLKNDGTVEMNAWFHNLAFDVHIYNICLPS